MSAVPPTQMHPTQTLHVFLLAFYEPAATETCPQTWWDLQLQPGRVLLEIWRDNGHLSRRRRVSDSSLSTDVQPCCCWSGWRFIRTFQGPFSPEIPLITAHISHKNVVWFLLIVYMGSCCRGGAVLVLCGSIIRDMWTVLLLVNKIRHISASRHIEMRARIYDVFMAAKGGKYLTAVCLHTIERKQLMFWFNFLMQ